MEEALEKIIKLWCLDKNLRPLRNTLIDTKKQKKKLNKSLRWNKSI